jgi:hypothetical protein
MVEEITVSPIRGKRMISGKKNKDAEIFLLKECKAILINFTDATVKTSF